MGQIGCIVDCARAPEDRAAPSRIAPDWAEYVVLGVVIP